MNDIVIRQTLTMGRVIVHLVDGRLMPRDFDLECTWDGLRRELEADWKEHGCCEFLVEDAIFEDGSGFSVRRKQ